jgi:hypothetical protein
MRSVLGCVFLFCVVVAKIDREREREREKRDMKREKKTRKKGEQEETRNRKNGSLDYSVQNLVRKCLQSEVI